MSNYRPISIIPTTSKIFERAIYNRLFKFLTSNNVPFPSQYGFRAGHSTVNVATEFVNEILQAIEDNKYTIGVFLNLSKAFNTKRS